jgi:hypothetical protein
MRAAEGNEFGNRMAQLLGLPKNTLGFVLSCRVNEMVTVTCEYMPEVHDGGDELMTSVMAEYRVERIEAGPAQASHHNSAGGGQKSERDQP